jgi:hypothetical protein
LRPSLDEVWSADNRDKLLTVLKATTSRYHGTRIVLTTRSASYYTGPLNFVSLEVWFCRLVAKFRRQRPGWRMEALSRCAVANVLAHMCSHLVGASVNAFFSNLSLITGHREPLSAKLLIALVTLAALSIAAFVGFGVHL